uniref:Uncharacterized protein n=1 Tax=Amphimedon queenslandica TaxID=400682 RepID=A0A1X7SY04_AMPQE
MAVSSSATSSVTRTSYAFDTLCSGSPCCVCDANCLSKLTKNFRTPRSVAASLYKKLDEIIHEIEARRGCQLVGFSIGRAPINKRESTKRKGTYCSLDIMDPKTWNKDALKLQWEECKRSDSCGKDGLIVLSVVTEAETPINYSSHEEYVIKIEEELRSYIMFETNDNRLQITSFSLQKSKGKAHAYAIYVAMKLLESFNEVWKGGAEGSAVMHTHQYDEESKSHTKVNKLEVEEDNKELKENESELRKAVKETTQLSKSPKESHQIKVTQEESRQLKLQLSEMAELSKARETELERVKEENAQLNSQLHHNVEKIHRAKLVAEEENERLKVPFV